MSLDSGAMEAALARGRVPGVCAAALELIEELVARPDVVALNRHPLGFAHAKLGTFEGGVIRLHIWPSEPIPVQDPPWLIHRHSWHLTSYVFRGGVENNIYEIEPDDRGDRRLYTVGYEGDSSVMKATDKVVTCVTLSSQEVLEGHRYEVDGSAFHSTNTASRMPTATIAITGKSSGQVPTVIGALDGVNAYRFRREVFSASKAADYYRSLL